jgi:hypothetical protein
MNKYPQTYYVKRQDIAIRSARRIVSLLQATYPVKSVIDFGCADGAWLSVFAEKGIDDFIGVDGPWMDQEQLLIPKDRFIAADFSRTIPELNRKFDLVSCIEVIEHIPDEQGKYLIGQMCSLSDMILFSAAVPWQGGTGHVNERRQSYWMEKFAKHGFVPYDLFRSAIWNDDSINVIYKQNMFLYVNQKAEKLLTKVLDEYRVIDVTRMDIIHPNLYEMRVSKLKQQQRRPSITRRLYRKILALVFPTK